ncbi:hypothetical protein ONZ45_g16820 [Pleurotus djamor]|nr:hypothetical protein ONZ45_g16820 [Pleurotus djamor]
MDSISGPDDIDIDPDGEGELGHDDNDEEQFFDTRSATPSTSSSGVKGVKEARARRTTRRMIQSILSPPDPISSSTYLSDRLNRLTLRKGTTIMLEGRVLSMMMDDIEDAWVDPSVSSPSPQSQPNSLPSASSTSPTPVSDPGPGPSARQAS